MKKNLMLLTILALSFILLACSDKDKKASSNELNLIEEGKLVVATSADFPPFEYITNDGLFESFDGIDVALALKICEKLDLELVMKDMEFTSLLGVLPTGSADVVMAGFANTPDRAENMSFTEAYYLAKQVIMMPEGAGITGANDILDLKVGAIESFVSESIVRELEIKEISTYKKAADGVMDLKNGRIDALVLDLPTANALLLENDGFEVVEDSEVFETEYYSIATKKDNKALLDALNKILDDMKKSGEIDEIIASYMQ